MKDRDLIPAMLFGAVMGTLVTLALREPGLLFPGGLTGLITAATTIVVGWWIHGAVRHRGELDRIPIDYLSDLNRRIDELVSTCLRGTRAPEYVANFTRLSNEVHWLGVILAHARPDLEATGRELASLFFEFKTYLTGGDVADVAAAVRASHDLRVLVLRVQLLVCRAVLDRPVGADLFPPRVAGG